MFQSYYLNVGPGPISLPCSTSSSIAPTVQNVQDKVLTVYKTFESTAYPPVQHSVHVLFEKQ